MRDGAGTGIIAPTDDAVPFFGKADAASGEVDPFAGLDLPETAALRKPVEGLGTPSQLAGKRATEASSLPFDVSAYETVTSLERLKEWVAAAREQGFVAVDTETSDLDANLADLVGFSLALEPGKACLRAAPAPRTNPISSAAGSCRARSPSATRSTCIRPLLEDASILKIGQNLKYDWIVLKRHGIEVQPFDDTMLISYVLDAGKGSHGMDELSRRHLGHSPITLLRGGGHGQEQGHLRQGRDRQGHGLRGGGCGRDLAPVAAAEAAPRRRAPGHGLRDAGAAAGRRARAAWRCAASRSTGRS